MVHFCIFVINFACVNNNVVGTAGTASCHTCCNVKNKKSRIQLIKELVRDYCIGSQNELSEMLSERGYNVTQATLSRDLKTLRITKVANDNGNYMYIIPAGNEIQDSLLRSGQSSITASQNVGFVSIEFSGNIAIIKTRNGYAAGVAYDIDMSRVPEVMGTIAGADTVFAVLREGVTRRRALEVFARFIPIQNLVEGGDYEE